MANYFPYIIAGITIGAVYGLNATGLVLTYRTSGIFNFALGALGTLSSTVFYWLHVTHGVAWPISLVLSVLVLGTALGFGLERIARGLARAETAYQAAATIGVVVSIEAVVSIWYGQNALPFPAFLPTHSVKIGDTYVTVNQLITVAISLVLVVGLYLFMRRARLGKLMRAVVDDPDLISLAGSNPNYVRKWAWVIGANLATLSGILIAPTTSLDPTLLTLLVVASFAAAAIGAFSSIPLSFAGGLLLGIMSAFAGKYSISNQWLAGIPNGFPFLILIIALILIPKAKLRTGERLNATVRTVSRPWRAPTRVAIPTATAFTVLLLLVPMFAGYKINSYTSALAYLILFLSLGMLVRVSRQIVLCQYAFAGIGAATMGHLLTRGVPWGVALLLAGLVLVPIGAIVAIPAVRLSGVFLGLATLGFSLFVEQIFYSTPIMFGQSISGVSVGRPSIGDLATSNTGFYYFMLATAVVASVGTMAMLRGRLGRLLGALGDSPSALETGGVSLNLLKVTVFALSAFMAGISGALIGATNLFAVGTMFTTIGSLTLFALIIFVPGQTPWYAINCAFGFAVLPVLIPGANTAEYFQTLFGVSAVVVAYQRGKGKKLEAVPLTIRRFVDSLGGRPKEDSVITQEIVASIPSSRQVRERATFASPGARALAAEADGLVVENLSVRFGGLHAVADLSLCAPRKGITGLIGPNGAGKSTTFNACCGLVTPSAGKVSLGKTDLSGMSASRRARNGLGRTFQQMQLYESADVKANIAMGCEARLIGRNLVGQFFTSRHERRRMKERTEAALQACAIEAYADRSVVELPTGIRRLVELARVLAGEFDFLLLDEPSSGLNNIETERFGNLLLDYASGEHACGILLVEHDMSLVMEVCSYIYVMDFGKLIFEGTPEEVKASPIVQAAYLGAEDVQLLDDDDLVVLEASD